MIRQALLLCWLFNAHGFSVERKRMAGIWQLRLDPSSALNRNSGKPILLKIQDDGSFQQCDDDNFYDCFEGCWDFEGCTAQLQLAIDRKSLSSCNDTLLSGKVSGQHIISVEKGVVSAGKFMYLKSHKAFFDQVMAASDVVGKFSLKQVMGFHQMMIPSSSTTEDNEEAPPQVTASDFFDRNFIMTVEPIESKVQPKAWDEQNGQWYNPRDDQAVDIRTMPVQFFANSTFQALGVNKILRGRFEVTGEQMLWFHVSRFGMGRSTPGSVYSEGLGLSHEDERTYVGQIQQDKQSGGDNNAQITGDLPLRVEGKVTFGADLGSDARPEPVGTFILHEVNDPSRDMNEEDDTSDADDIFSSVFE